MEHINLWPYVVGNIISDDIIDGDVYVEVVLGLNFNINDSVELLRKNCCVGIVGIVDISKVLEVLHGN